MGTTTDTVLTAEQRQAWERDGYVLVREFAAEPTMSRMLARVIEICRLAASGQSAAPALVMQEVKTLPGAKLPEEQISKVFRIHRDSVFEEFAHDPRLLAYVGDLLGPDVDIFLSQFIFKNPAAMGQPWHQDSLYFDFEPDHQLGVWLAVTEATLANGCLWVIPGSQSEPVHTHVPDHRPDANYGYMEITDHDMSAAVPVTMNPGDLLLFDSHVMHQSTDNVSDGIRAAMVYHYSPAPTFDHTPDAKAFINDWRPATRAGAPV